MLTLVDVKSKLKRCEKRCLSCMIKYFLFPGRTEAMKIIEEELCAPVESFFSYMSEEPVAATSFGKVYMGSTLDGVSDAVKVQRPNLRHVVVRDVHILRLGVHTKLFLSWEL